MRVAVSTPHHLRDDPSSCFCGSEKMVKRGRNINLKLHAIRIIQVDRGTSVQDHSVAAVPYMLPFCKDIEVFPHGIAVVCA